MKRIFFIIMLFLVGGLSAQEIPLPGSEEDPVVDDKILNESMVLPGKNKFNFTGYIENTFNTEYNSDYNESLLNKTRARVMIDGESGSNFDYALVIIGNIYSGKTGVNMEDYLPEKYKDEVDDTASDLYSFEYANEIYIQEAFGTLKSKYMSFRIGRQKYYSGNGYAYNPTDFFNVKNPMDPSYEIDGIDGALLSFYLPANTKIEGFFHFAENFKESNYQSKIIFQFLTAEVTFQYTYYHDYRTDYESINNSVSAQNIVTGVEKIEDYQIEYKKHFAGGSLSVDMFGIGLHGEGGYVLTKAGSEEDNLDLEKDYEMILAGFDYTFESQFYILFEYYRNGLAGSNIDDVEINERFAYLGGETDVVFRDNIFSMITYPLTDLTDISLAIITGVNDNSYIFNPSIKYAIFSGCNIELVGAMPYGKKNSSVDGYGYSGFLRMKYNF